MRHFFTHVHNDVLMFLSVCYHKSMKTTVTLPSTKYLEFRSHRARGTDIYQPRVPLTMFSLSSFICFPLKDPCLLHEKSNCKKFLKVQRNLYFLSLMEVGLVSAADRDLFHFHILEMIKDQSF